jgi:hypothetical protein
MIVAESDGLLRIRISQIPRPRPFFTTPHFFCRSAHRSALARSLAPKRRESTAPAGPSPTTQQEVRSTARGKRAVAAFFPEYGLSFAYITGQRTATPSARGLENHRPRAAHSQNETARKRTAGFTCREDAGLSSQTKLLSRCPFAAGPSPSN